MNENISFLAIGAILLLTALGTIVHAQENNEETEADGPYREEVTFYVDHLDAGNPYLTDWARQELIDLGSRAVPALLEELNNRDARIRFLIVEILGEIRDGRATEALRNRLADSGANPSVSSAAARALGKIGNREAIPDLRNRLDEVTDPEVIYNTIWALGNLRAEKATQDIIPFLDDTRSTFYDQRISNAALQALGKLRAREALPHIRDLLNSDRSEEVEEATGLPTKFYAVRALEQIARETKGPVMTDQSNQKQTTVDRWLSWIQQELGEENGESENGSRSGNNNENNQNNENGNNQNNGQSGNNEGE